MSTIRKVIERIDTNKPNAFTTENKVAWLAELDGKIAVDVFLLDVTELQQFNYDPETDWDSELLVNFPHDDIYYYWLSAKIDAENGEYDKYQNTMQLYNTSYNNFVTWFLRAYEPAQGCHGKWTHRCGTPSHYISAYGLAVKHGFRGTEAQWLDFLHGEKGDKVELRYTGTTIQWRQVPHDGADDAEAGWLDLIDMEDMRADVVDDVLQKAAASAAQAEAAQAGAVDAAAASDTCANRAAASAAQADVSAAAALQRVQDAEQKANEAEQWAAKSQFYAETIDPELINRRIDQKADNLWRDPNTGLLYLLSDGKIIGDGIKADASALVCQAALPMVALEGMTVNLSLENMNRTPVQGEVFTAMAAKRYTVFQVVAVSQNTFAATVLASVDTGGTGGSGGGIAAETDPTVPEWAKQPNKPTYTASEVGARPDTWTPTAQEVGALPNSYTPPNQTAEQVGADPKGTAAGAVSDHNTNTASHEDIRLLIEGLATRLNALANSTDTDLDQMAELVAYIKNNKSLIDGITTSKVSVADIVNNLTTNVANKPLSAAQGVALKALIDAITVPTKLSQLTNDKGYLTEHQDISGKLDASALPTAINTALAQAKASGEFDGEDGKRGTGLLSVTTAPSSYTTAVGGITPKYRMALSTIKTQAGVTEVLLGDTVRYSYYHYPIDYMDASYAYFTERVSIRGATGAAGTAGKDYSFDPTIYGLPVLELTGDTAPIAASKDNKVTLSYVYGDRSGTCTLKGQGATSYKTAQALVNAGKAGKFNYTINFDNAFEAKSGWGAQKKYCLKANFIDTTHSRNIVSCILWGMSVKERSTVPSQLANLPNGGAIDGFPIIIMLNDEFHGLYTWNIPKDGWMFGLVEDTAKTQAIVGADDHTAATQFKSASMSGFEVEFVSDEDNADWVNTSITRLISAVMNSDGSDLDTTVAQYLDWDSAIDHYIHTVVDKATDCIDKNYLLVTFDGVKWYMSAYDRDSIHGLNWDASGTTRPVSNVSFTECAETVRVYELIKRFKTNALKARYKKLRGNILSESRIMEKVENFAWAIPSPVMLEDVKLYPTIMGSGVNTIDQIGRFVRQRLARCDEWIDSLPAQESTGGSTVTTYAVTNALSNCVSSNGATAVNANAAYSATITASDGYTLDGASVTITMGGTNITSTAYSAGKVSIAKVTGAVVITISAVKKASGYTNLVPTSTDTDGTVYNGTGYKDNARLSSSGGVSGSAQNGSVVTGFIPFKSTDIIRMKGAEWISKTNAHEGHYYLNFYNSSKDMIAGIPASGYATNYASAASFTYDEATGVTTFDIVDSSEFAKTIASAAYFRINSYGKGADLIITVNQEIT